MQENDAREALGMLTPKHIEVLDLLSEHMTTKEIARRLNVAPTTVDQRISAIRERWGTSNRKATIRLYSELLYICGKTTYDISLVDGDQSEGETDERDARPEPLFSLAASEGTFLGEEFDELLKADMGALHRFDVKFGLSGRIGLVVALAMMFAVTIVAMLAIGKSAGEIISP